MIFTVFRFACLEEQHHVCCGTSSVLPSPLNLVLRGESQGKQGKAYRLWQSAQVEVDCGLRLKPLASMRTRISELGIPHWIQQVSVAEDRGQIRADATWWMMQHFTRHLLSGLPIDAILDKTYTAAWETAL